MHIGQQVLYEDSDGHRHTATVTEVAGTGESGMKTLDLAFEGGKAGNVPHSLDQGDKGFWLLEDEKVARGTRTPKARRNKREK